MIINLWSTPRTGSNWYARKLVKEYEAQTDSEVILLSELFNKNIYDYYCKNIDGKIYFLKDFSNDCYFTEYKLDDDGKIIQELIYEQRKISASEEEDYRFDLVMKANPKYIMIMSNHVAPINIKIYDQLYKMADRNIFLHRTNIKNQLASYCVSYHSKQFINFSDYEDESSLKDITVSRLVLDNIAYRILHWYTLKKQNAEIIDYESINFNEYIDDMPKQQNRKPAIELLSEETKLLVDEVEAYIQKYI